MWPSPPYTPRQFPLVDASEAIKLAAALTGSARGCCGFEEYAAHDGIGPGNPAHIDFHVPRNIPDEIGSVGKCSDALRREYGITAGVHDLQCFRSGLRVPVDSVDRHLVGVAIGKIDIQIECSITGVPAGRESRWRECCLWKTRARGHPTYWRPKYNSPHFPA